MNFTDLFRTPDDVRLQTAEGFSPMERTAVGLFAAGPVTFSLQEGKCVIACTSDPGTMAPKRFRIRWNGDNRAVRSIYCDAWERACNDIHFGRVPIGWKGVRAELPMPWYFLASDGSQDRRAGSVIGCGVKTGPNAFVFWQLDPYGVTLWLDVRCGGDGLRPKEAFTAAEIVAAASLEGESPYRTAQRFAGIMCERPVLPKRPVFGSNNWYYAYGDVSSESVHADAALMGSLVDGSLRPYMVIDDGWQLHRRREYIGGPWVPNAKFPDMAACASDIEAQGCIPGIWMRPLLCEDPRVPESWHLTRTEGILPQAGFILDPSVPDVLEHLREDILRIRSWGFGLIKHDFSFSDIMGEFGHVTFHQLSPEGWHFADRSMTTAQVMKRLYGTIQDAAGDALVIGCNTTNHLTAGIHALMRSGSDTSGRVWEITRAAGVSTLAHRLHQNGRFFMTDADCAAFSERVPSEMNLRFADLVARSGSALFCSVTPGLLTADEAARLRRIYAVAAEADHDLEPLDWTYSSCPGEYLDRGEPLSYDWFTPCSGVRTFYGWMG